MCHRDAGVHGRQMPVAKAYKCGATDPSHRQLLCKRQCKITHADTSSASAAITAASRVNLTHFLRHSSCIRIKRAWRRPRKRLPTVADGCGHRRNFRRTQPHPQTPKVKREPSLRIREKTLWTNDVFRFANVHATYQFSDFVANSHVAIFHCWRHQRSWQHQ